MIITAGRWGSGISVVTFASPFHPSTSRRVSNRSRQIMRKMYAKVISNKILLVFIIVCEIVTLMFVVWYKWIR